jgi:hypothetical protein
VRIIINIQSKTGKTSEQANKRTSDEQCSAVQGREEEAEGEGGEGEEVCF